MYSQQAIITKNPNMFIIFKPLYILHSMFGISAFSFDREKIIPVGKLRKVLCILGCVCIVFGNPFNNENMFSNKFTKDRLKNTMESLYDVSIRLCAFIVWVRASFVSNENTIKMILNYYEVESHLKVIKKFKPFGPQCLKILFFHMFTILIMIFYSTLCVAVLDYTLLDLWPFVPILINNLVIQKFATEIYVIILYVDKITIEIKGFSKRSTEKLEKAVEIQSNEINTLMQLYNKLSENSCISNNLFELPVIPCTFKTTLIFHHIQFFYCVIEIDN